jgi:DNA gyrase subunit A
MLITDKGQTLRTTVSEIRETGRNAQGVKIMNVDGEEKVVAVERLAESSADGGTGGTEPPPEEGGDGGGDAGGDGGAPGITPPAGGDGELN